MMFSGPNSCLSSYGFRVAASILSLVAREYFNFPRKVSFIGCLLAPPASQKSDIRQFGRKKELLDLGSLRTGGCHRLMSKKRKTSPECSSGADG